MVRLAVDYNRRIHADFEAALGRLDALGREPGRREQDFLAHALAFMACGNYRFARIELQAFARMLGEPETLDRPSRSDRQPYTVAMLRRGHLRIGAFL